MGGTQDKAARMGLTAASRRFENGGLNCVRSDLMTAAFCKAAWLAGLVLVAGTRAQQPSRAASAAVRQYLSADRQNDLGLVMQRELRLLSSSDVEERSDAADGLLA